MKINKIKIIVTSLIVFAFVTVSNAQKYGKVKGSGNVINKTRNVGAFEKVGVSGSFDVFLVKGKEGKIDIKIEDNLLSHLVTVVDNGKLKIKWKKGVSIRTNKTTQLTVYYNDINAVGLSGSGDIIGKDLIKSNDFSVAVAGSGDIDLHLDANNIKAAISGSGDIQLKGVAKVFSGAIAGSGDISAYDLKSDKVILKISGSGDMTVNVSNELEARISGSGDIKYKGNPRIEDIKVSGSGSVGTY